MQLREDLGPLRRRAAVLIAAIFVSLVVLHLRLVQLQIVGGAHWRRMAENNRLRNLPLDSSRGLIYDRNGNLLATNIPTWELLLFPDEAAHLAETVLLLAKVGVGSAADLNELVRSRPRGQLAPIIVAEDLSWEQVARVRSHQSDHPELAVVRRFRRHYPYCQVAAHAVGHLRTVTETEVLNDPSLSPRSLVGATGVEASQNSRLSGRDGERWVVISAVGRQLGVVRELPSIPGNDLTLTLDLNLQRKAVEALGDAAGAIVALDPRSGAVRAFYSAPSFDPNIFVGRLTSAEWQTLRDDPLHPLQSRCVQGTYPPGSTVKPFLALGGLTDGTISPHFRAFCRGSVTLYGHPFRCWNRGGHGGVGVAHSLEVSCDTFYYYLGQRMGIERMAYWLKTFGFGQLSGGGFPAEKAGLVGTPQWKLEVRKEPWYPGEAVSVSIGQGPLNATVLQVARACAAVANGGWLVTPHLVEGPNHLDRINLGLDPEHLGLIQEGLRRAVHGQQATAYRVAHLPVAGKTGTAQVARLVEGQTLEEMDPRLRHHAWFVGWGPVQEPQIVVAVLVEHGGGGGSVAVPVAGRVLAAALGIGTQPEASPPTADPGAGSGLN